MPLALFDVDGTLIPGTTYGNLLLELHRRGLLGVRYLAWGAGVWAGHRLGRVHDAAVLQRAAGLLAGLEVDRAEEIFRRVAGRVRRKLIPASLELLRRHHRAGDRVVLISTSPEPVVVRLGRELGAERCIATRLRCHEGKLTGEIEPPLPFGRAKVGLAEGLARVLQEDLREATFYADSYSDLPLLQRVGHPRPVRPDPRLRREARRRGWNRKNHVIL